ncbi:MAG: DNA mismatch repair protein MutL, partial [Bacteroidetes bacterium]|nr:DNA mismatch repair protein MutL [Bacteroidota bacterium]
ARMAFERHATSKIKDIDDLFRIKTMGFRGEALASIAAVAQVELKTKKAEDAAGTYIEIENSIVKKQEPVAYINGTSIAMKNLFFNVPARRNFLKSNAAEMRHIIDEFIRVALSFPEIFFSVISNNEEIFHLEKGTLKQRIVQILGDSLNSKLVSVNENMDYLNIYGFVGKPEAAKKTRGDQYFFVNNRFIKSAYLNHAVMGAYQQMIAADSFPLYVLFIDLEPSQVDINVHPTKQEIKFEDEKIVYAFVQAAVKHALAQFSITPTLDFDLDPSIQQLDAVSKPFTEDKKAEAASSSLYKTFTQKNQAHFIERENKSELKHWKEFYESPKKESGIQTADDGRQLSTNSHQSFDSGLLNTDIRRPTTEIRNLAQIHNSYILAQTVRGFLLINQQFAHERILYERYVAAYETKSMASQKNLFPVTLNLSAQDAVLLNELLSDLNTLGYLIEPFGKDAFIIQGTPADVADGNEKSAIENLLEQFKHFSSDIKFSKREKLIRSLAWQHAIKTNVPLTEKEMDTLVEELFKCTQPNITPSGKPTYLEFKKDYIEKLFEK